MTIAISGLSSLIEDSHTSLLRYSSSRAWELDCDKLLFLPECQRTYATRIIKFLPYFPGGQMCQASMYKYRVRTLACSQLCESRLSNSVDLSDTWVWRKIVLAR